jgi:hypothetical protein
LRAFVVHHWRLLAGIAAGLFGVALGRGAGQGKVRQRVEIEQDAELVRRRVEQINIDHGAAAAHAAVTETYSAEIQALDKSQATQAALLQSDPKALAAFLVLQSGSQKKP